MPSSVRTPATSGMATIAGTPAISISTRTPCIPTARAQRKASMPARSESPGAGCL